MLEDHPFCDHCPGCRPALIDTTTGKPVGDDELVIVNRVWDRETTYAERKAFIEVTVHNSRKPEEMRLAKAVVARIAKALEKS